MRFNKTKCKMLHLGWDNPQYRRRDKQIESSPAEMDMGVLVNERLDMCHQCALAAQRAKFVLDCIRNSIGSRLREEILPLYSTLLRSHLEYCIQLWYPQHRKEIDIAPTGKSPQECHQGDYRNGAPNLRGKMKRVGLVQPGKES
ncbi:hypothetical protein WISP_04489 [Willisornis vidua]|uniref:Uncharacterized protein n=1 Tax=Willisornis vidua TaxID=1566151 RepID=A0ABQ9DTA1_9PASS|nr:hypothetical protein WISP_04489 [Willisornis vidua]